MRMAGGREEKRKCDADGCGQKCASCVSFVTNIEYHITYVAFLFMSMCCEFLNLFQCPHTRHLRASSQYPHSSLSYYTIFFAKSFCY